MKKSYSLFLTVLCSVVIQSCQTKNNQSVPAPLAELAADSSISFPYESSNPDFIISDDLDENNFRTADASSAQEKAILKLVNEARSKSCKCGSTTYKAVSALTLSPKLINAADKHAISMAKYNYFSHDGRNGSSMAQRVNAESYSWRYLGENIAAGYSTTKAAVDGWMKSEGHCKNIMNGSYKELGVGYGYNAGSTFKYYWVTDFGTKQ